MHADHIPSASVLNIKIMMVQIFVVMSEKNSLIEVEFVGDYALGWIT
jgi:hypothetical protein